MFRGGGAIALIATMFFTGGLGAAGQPDPAVAAAIGVWYDEGGRDHLSALASDFGDISEAAGKADIDGLHGACEELKRDVDAAQEFRAMPDREAQEHWADALEHYELSAVACVDGTEGVPDLRLLEQFATESTLGQVDIEALQDRIDEVAGTR